jgi:hypothetical protein
MSVHLYIWEAQEKTKVEQDVRRLQKSLGFWEPFLASPSLMEILTSLCTLSFLWIQGKKALTP